MCEKYTSLKIVAILAVLLVAVVEPANILGVFTSNSPSHQIIHMAYVKALIERGHNVTVVTTTLLKDKNPRYHYIHIPETEARIKEVVERQKALKDQKLETTWQYLWSAVSSLKTFGGVQYDAIKSEKFQELMHNPGNKFDLVIVGYFFNYYSLGLGEHFNCPVIVSGVSVSDDLLDRLMGNPPEISYIQSLISMSKQDYMTFWGRLHYFYERVLCKIFIFMMDKYFNEAYNDLFSPSKYPPLEHAMKKVSLLLLNTHLSENGARAIAPSVIEVGGIQIKDKPDPLPKNLQEIINSSKHGVIYVSFGSNLGSKEIGLELVQKLFKALSNLKYTVIWKWEDEEKLGNSPNIHFVKWLPQTDLLAHKDTKLFINHAGKGSIVEGIFHGVPMLTIPFYIDQPKNAEKLANDGFGISINRYSATEESIQAAILEALENPKYRQKVQEFSRLYRDRPMSAKETAMFWIEYVLRHKGAYHMQSPAIHLNFFQYSSLDVIGFLLLVAFLIFKIISISMRFLFRKILCTKSNLKKEKLKQK